MTDEKFKRATNIKREIRELEEYSDFVSMYYNNSERNADLDKILSIAKENTDKCIRVLRTEFKNL